MTRNQCSVMTEKKLLVKSSFKECIYTVVILVSAVFCVTLCLLQIARRIDIDDFLFLLVRLTASFGNFVCVLFPKIYAHLCI